MLLLTLLACVQPQAPTPPQTWMLTGESMGTTWMVKWAGVDRSAEVRPAVDDALRQIDLAMSTWKDDSEISRIRAAQVPVEVSVETAFVVDQALDLARMTGGAFDPTVQPLVELWGFHGQTRDTLPTQEELTEAMAHVGYDKVRVSWTLDGHPTVDAGGTALDLSAIAKGHAVDRVSAALSRLGLGTHMVEVGGEVRVSGPGASSDLWRVGVDRPIMGSLPGQDLQGVVSLVNGAVATSGNYRNARRIEGKDYGHTLDPRTGWPADTQVRSATVVAPDCRTADGLATALMVLGEEGLPLVEGLADTEVLLLIGEELRVAETSGMDELYQSL